MQRDEPFHPRSDDAAADLTQEFWGTSSGWDDRPIARVDDAPAPRARPDDTTGAVRAIRDGLHAFRPRVADHPTGEVRRTRRHGAGTTPLRTDGDMGDHRGPDVGDVPFRVAIGTDDDPDHTDDHLVPLGPPPIGERFGLGSVDPLLVRIGLVVVAFVLLIPLALSLRSDEPGMVTTGSGAPAVPTANPTDGSSSTPSSTPGAETEPVGSNTDGPSDGAAPSDPAPGGGAGAASTPPTAVSAAADEATVEPVRPDGDAVDAVERSVVEPIGEPLASAESAPSGAEASEIADEPATVDALADRVEPNCSLSYVARAGDSWFSIAAAADVTPTDLVSENRATLETVIVPGDEVCLPDGATVPSGSDPEDSDPEESEPEDSGPARTDPTTTTTAPATTTTEPREAAPSYTTDEVQQIIREVWPDDLEDKALDIAFRESRYDARAYNGWCCYGVFQLYWTVHQSWLGDYGIDSIEDLYDARKNTEAAYAMYQASGWGPWGG